MIHRLALVSALSSVLLFSCESESASGDCDETASSADQGSSDCGKAADHREAGPARVVGYLPTYRNLDPSRYDLAALTHLCIAFANPIGEGGESDFDEAVQDQIQPLVDAAHEQGVKVLASIAGGTKESGELVAAQITPERVDAYVEGLVAVVEKYGLDGIDNDIEGEAINDNYLPLVEKLRDALPEEAVLSAAVATKHGERVPTGALEIYDFVNIMAYDHCSWTDEACDQASYEGVLEDLDYWTEQRVLPYRKAVLGVPFYGWCWGCEESQVAQTWIQIVRAYPEARTTDWIEDGEITISLNSPDTIARKTELARAYGGVMIWELGQDASGSDSLLGVVSDLQPE